MVYKTDSNTLTRIMVIMMTFYLSVVYLYLFIGIVLRLVKPHSRPQLFWFYLINPTDTTFYIQNSSTNTPDYKLEFSDKQERLAAFFHRKNQSVLFALGEKAESENRLSDAEGYYWQHLLLNPYAIDLNLSYFRLLAREAKAKMLGASMDAYTRVIAPPELQGKINEINFLDRAFTVHLGRYLRELKIRNVSTLDKPDALMYILGWSAYKYDPWVTGQFWELARDIHPDYGHYHIELASLYYYVFNDRKAVYRLLKRCVTYSLARDECEQYMTLIDSGLPEPGFYFNLVVYEEGG